MVALIFRIKKNAKLIQRVEEGCQGLENGEDEKQLLKQYEISVIRLVISLALMHPMVTIVNTVLYNRSLLKD